MKKLTVIPILFFVATIFGQGKMLCIQPSCSQKVHVGDTVFIFAQLTSTDQFGAIVFTQASGPSVSQIGLPTTVYNSGIQAQTQVQLKNLIPGTYIYNVIGTSKTGATVSTLDSVFVSPAIIAGKYPVYSITVYNDSSRMNTKF